MIGGRTRSTNSKARNLHFAPRPRRRTPLRMAVGVAVVVVLLLAAGAVKAALASEPPLRVTPVLGATRVLAGPAPRPVWPAAGEAAVEVEGLPPLGSSGGSGPVPIASLAKIMTAYVVLADDPIRPGAPGYTVTLSAADEADYRRRLAAAESVVPVATGEQLTELQLLQGLLIASGNNFAAILAVHDAGSEAAFVAKMQAAARALGMAHTTYTDPSGLNATTVSSASDQLVLAARAMADPVFASIVARTSVTLPVAGQLSNYNRAVGTDGYVGVKTGSDSTAGGCLVFADRRQVGARQVIILGAVLGQDKGHQSTTALLTAAETAADALVRSVAAAVGPRTVLPAGTVVATVSNADGRRSAAVTTSPVTVTGYGGMAVPLSVSLRRVGTKVASGRTLGKVSVPGGATTAVVTRGSVPQASFAWKLLHDF